MLWPKFLDLYFYIVICLSFSQYYENNQTSQKITQKKPKAPKMSRGQSFQRQ